MTSETTPITAVRQDAAAALAHVVPGRDCGTCTMCCKLIAVEELSKTPGTWCPHCVRGKGCGIYDTRPTECRTFFCHWMVEKGLGPDWKPERSKLILVTSEGGHMTAFVDPGSPAAWRKAPYFDTLRRWAHEGARATPMRIVSVRIGTRGIVILPDREVDIGTVAANEAIRLEPGPGGRIEVRKFSREG
jgi:hypothetical protein